MVSNGWALAYRQYSKEFVPLEEKARAKGVRRGRSEGPTVLCFSSGERQGD